MKRTHYLILLFFVFSIGKSSADSVPDRRFYPSATMGFNFNIDDFFVGFGAGIEDMKHLWGARIGFDFRPYFSKVQIQDNSNVISQYYERKYFLTLDLEKRFFEFLIGKASLRPFVSIRPGLLFGNYRGLRKAPDSFVSLSPVAGLSFGNKFASWKIGYSWLNMHTIDASPGRLILQVTFLLD